MRRLSSLLGGPTDCTVEVDRRLASLWFGTSLQPQGWAVPGVWDDLAGDYRTVDGWVKLHTNAPRHRAAALCVLGCASTKDAVAATVATWAAGDLESAIVDAGGCCAAMRSPEEWGEHPQGLAVASERLLDVEFGLAVSPATTTASARRPLQGVRVLDLTRILAGPVATRVLAGLGADVLRIDPPDWDEPALAPEVTLGKRCARLDLRSEPARRRFEDLLAEADILVHGYRPGALDALGFGRERRAVIAPALVEATLNAYGWTGPWNGRRGFDSLVQMSSGIACVGQRSTRSERPVPLPVQALDHATGYLLAAGALHGWCERLTTGRPSASRASLARTAQILIDNPTVDPTYIAELDDADISETVEHTAWGSGRRLRFPLQVTGVEFRWDRPASRLGSERAPFVWNAQRCAESYSTDPLLVPWR